MTLLPSDRAPGLHVAPDVEVPDDASIAPHVTIYPGVRLGARVSLEQGAVVGRPQKLDARSRSPKRPAGEPTVIGDDCLIGHGAVVAAGARLGDRSTVSDLALVREGALVGCDVLAGRLCVVSRDTEIGDRTRLQNNTIVGPWTRIEEDVLVSPSVLFMSDPTMGRRPVNAVPGGIVVRRASRIGAGALIYQDVEIGEEAVVGANAQVRADVPARTVVIGAPARYLRDVAEEELVELWRQDGR